MIKSIVTVALSLLILDAIWLGIIGKPLYIHYLNSVARFSNGSFQPLWLPAIIVYIALVAGITLFVLPKADGSIIYGLVYGGLFGLITYAVYDFTNLAVLAQWSLTISIIDVIWGGVLGAISSALGVWVGS